MMLGLSDKMDLYNKTFIKYIILDFALLCGVITIFLFIPSLPFFVYGFIGIGCAIPFFITMNRAVKQKIKNVNK